MPGEQSDASRRRREPRGAAPRTRKPRQPAHAESTQGSFPANCTSWAENRTTLVHSWPPPLSCIFSNWPFFTQISGRNSFQSFSGWRTRGVEFKGGSHHNRNPHNRRNRQNRHSRLLALYRQNRQNVPVLLFLGLFENTKENLKTPRISLTLRTLKNLGNRQKTPQRPRNSAATKTPRKQKHQGKEGQRPSWRLPP